MALRGNTSFSAAQSRDGGEGHYIDILSTALLDLFCSKGSGSIYHCADERL